MKIANSREADSLWKIGRDYHQRREFDKALDHYRQCLSIYKAKGDSEKVSVVLLDVGTVYMLKGEVKEAMEYFEPSLKLLKELNNLEGVGHALNNIGWTYRLKGDLEESLEHHLQALTLREKLGNIPDLAESLINLVFISLDLQEREQAQKYLIKLKKIATQQYDQETDRYTRLTEARFLKEGTTIKEKAKAQEILEGLIEENPNSYYALFYLCEILFFELKTFGDPKTLEKVKNLVQDLHTIAEKNKTFDLVIMVLLLNAKIAIIEGDFQNALKLLGQAKVTAEDKDLGLMLTAVMDEQKKISEELDMYKDLINRNTSIQERLQAIKLEVYLEEAKKIVEMSKEGKFS